MYPCSNHFQLDLFLLLKKMKHITLMKKVETNSINKINVNEFKYLTPLTDLQNLKIILKSTKPVKYN